MTAAPRAPEPRPDGSVPVLSPLGVVLGYAIPGRHLPAEANARRWAASGDLLKVLRRGVTEGDHPYDCSLMGQSVPDDAACDCWLVDAALAIDAAAPAEEVTGDG